MKQCIYCCQYKPQWEMVNSKMCHECKKEIARFTYKMKKKMLVA